MPSAGKGPFNNPQKFLGLYSLLHRPSWPSPPLNFCIFCDSNFYDWYDVVVARATDRRTDLSG